MAWRLPWASVSPFHLVFCLHTSLNSQSLKCLLCKWKKLRKKIALLQNLYPYIYRFAFRSHMHPPHPPSHQLCLPSDPIWRGHHSTAHTCSSHPTVPPQTPGPTWHPKSELQTVAVFVFQSQFQVLEQHPIANVPSFLPGLTKVFLLYSQVSHAQWVYY